jgi:hypothetical protein
MHTAAKVLLILGTIVTVLGIAGFALGVGQIDDVSDSWNNFEVEDGTAEPLGYLCKEAP